MSKDSPGRILDPGVHSLGRPILFGVLVCRDANFNAVRFQVLSYLDLCFAVIKNNLLHLAMRLSLDPAKTTFPPPRGLSFLLHVAHAGVLGRSVNEHDELICAIDRGSIYFRKVGVQNCTGPRLLDSGERIGLLGIASSIQSEPLFEEQTLVMSRP